LVGRLNVCYVKDCLSVASPLFDGRLVLNGGFLGRTFSGRRTVAGHPPPSLANCPECSPNQRVHRRSRIARCTVTVHPPPRCVRRRGSRAVKYRRVTSLSASAGSGDLFAYGVRGEALRALKKPKRGGTSQDSGRCSSRRRSRSRPRPRRKEAAR
jgi:hypothetical protein